LDTGVQASHGELSIPVSNTENFTDEGGENLDYEGHGTHVSGIVTSNGENCYDADCILSTKGVAPGANVFVVKVCAPVVSESGEVKVLCLEDDIVAGINWAESKGVAVINMSLGGGLTGAEHCDGDNDKVVDAVNNAANNAANNGIVFTISSGNNGSMFGVSYPACASGAIAVGAVDSSDKIASFSNTGSAMDVVAPGVRILSTYSCNAVAPTAANLTPCVDDWAAYLSGTSMSSPHVAGVVALMLEKNPDLSVDDVKKALYSTAKKIQSGKFDGNGRVDALAAVNYVSEPPGPDTEAPVIIAPTISDPFAQTTSDVYIESDCVVTDNDPLYDGTCSIDITKELIEINTAVLGFQSVTFPSADAEGNVPTPVTVSTTIVEPQASDDVEITKAEYRTRNGDLRVQATSNSLDPNTILTVEGYGEMKDNGDGTYQLRVRGATDPGGSVTVISSSGGSDTATVI